MTETAFGFIEVPRREDKPRSRGITFVIDHAFHLLGPNNLEDLLKVSADHIDYIKLAVATARLQPREVLLSRLALMQAHEVKPFIGGNFFELAIQRRSSKEFLDELQQLGISTLELSTQVITLSPRQQAKLVEQAIQRGLTVFGEVGRKEPDAPLVPSVTIQQIRRFLDAGASKVILESYEVEKMLMGDRAAANEAGNLLAILTEVGTEWVILEAPYNADPRVAREFYWWCIQHCGPEVNLGNVAPQLIPLLEQMRRGLHWRNLDQVVSVD
jgi:phosphosulfolactate synthase